MKSSLEVEAAVLAALEVVVAALAAHWAVDSDFNSYFDNPRNYS